MSSMTTADQLEQWRRLVAWTLWKVATVDEPDADGPLGDLPLLDQDAAQRVAERLFKDPTWVGNTVGEFAANWASREETIEFAAFLNLLLEERKE